MITSIRSNSYLWYRKQRPKPTECLVEHLLRNHRVEIPNKQLGTDFDRFLLIRRSFIDTDRLAIQSDPVHDPRRIFGVFFAHELDEPIALMLLGNAILGQMDVDNAPRLEHQLPHDAICDPLIEVTDVYRRLLILFPGSVSAAEKEINKAETYQCLAPDMAQRYENGASK